MKINLPIKLHNRFEVEVKNIDTGEVVQKGFAENIILNSLWNTSYFFSNNAYGAYVGNSILYGTGTGVLSPDRTTLFNELGQLTATLVESVYNQAPIASYCTKKIVINPGTHTGETLTEVGVGGAINDHTIYTHALIKDSEGNPLSLGPLEANQEVTIYRTVYFKPNFEAGITLYNLDRSESAYANMQNGLIAGALMESLVHIRSTSSAREAPCIVVNDNNSIYVGGASFRNYSNGVLSTNMIKFLSSDANGKIKRITARPSSASASNSRGSSVDIDLEVLAINNSALWGGWEFDKTPIGIGDDATTVFNLTWDEVWMEKPKSVYVDGVLESNVLWSTDSITFNTPPADQAVITADYWVKYAPKDDDHEFWVQLAINFNEGVAV